MIINSCFRFSRQRSYRCSLSFARESTRFRAQPGGCPLMGRVRGAWFGCGNFRTLMTRRSGRVAVGWLLQVFGARGLSRPPGHHWHPELFTERARHLTVDPAEGTQPCNFPTRSQATERMDTYACRTPCSQARRHGQSGWMRLIWGKRVLATDISPRPVCQCHSSFIVPYLSVTISIVAPG